jgi:polyisoprenoid-binding protein YceI
MKHVQAYVYTRRFIRPVFAILILLQCVACQTITPEEKQPPTPAISPAPPLPVANSIHYHIAAGRSMLRILVYRGGPLAQFGHNHVIEAGSLEGDVYLMPDLDASGFRFRIPVSGLVVDPEAARRQEGKEFSTQPSPQAIAGTRENMLGSKVLDAEHYPDIVIRSLGMVGPAWAPDLTVRITLHGVSRDQTIPVAIRSDGNIIVVTGTADLLQTDFGMTPFSVMGGGLQVQDRVRVRFHIVAVKD